ncbi:hypothetical protein FRC02_005091 [Tulasnella sp. 418]|nr:hypothetical protein FRC02_005091 [Tulasnella sp. 418]
MLASHRSASLRLAQASNGKVSKLGAVRTWFFDATQASGQVKATSGATSQILKGTGQNKAPKLGGVRTWFFDATQASGQVKGPNGATAQILKGTGQNKAPKLGGTRTWFFDATQASGQVKMSTGGAMKPNEAMVRKVGADSAHPVNNSANLAPAHK